MDLSADLLAALRYIVATHTAAVLTADSPPKRVTQREELLRGSLAGIDKILSLLAQDQKRAAELTALLHFLNDTGLAVHFGARIDCPGQPISKDEVLPHYVGLRNGLSKRLLAAALATRKTPWRRRSEWIELALRHLLALFEPDSRGQQVWPHQAIVPLPEAVVLAGRCYLHRGLAFLPQGRNPAELGDRRDFLEAGMRLVATAVDSAGNGPDYNQPDQLPRAVLHALLLHELQRLSPSGVYSQELSDLLETIQIVLSGKATLDPEEIFLLWLQGRVNQASTTANEWRQIGEAVAACPWSGGRDARYRLHLPLIGAWANWRASGTLENANRQAVLAALQKHQLYSPLWEEAVAFLRELKDKSCTDWSDFAYQVWRLCRDREKEFGFGFQIRQYWARLDELYRLVIGAMVEQGEVEKAAEVVDSLKARTTLTWRDMEGLLAGRSGTAEKCREAYYAMEAQAAMGVYAERLLDDDCRRLMQTAVAPTGRPLAKVPTGWVAVHFHLDETRGQAFLIGAPASVTEKAPSFDPRPLLAAWQIWRRHYGQMPTEIEFDRQQLDVSLPKWESENGQHLLDLCHRMGEQFSFLFRLAVNEEIKGLLFIPHGFLHQLPLHAAHKDSEYLFGRLPSVFLPAWEMLPATLPSTPGRNDADSFASLRDYEHGLVAAIKSAHSWNYFHGDIHGPKSPLWADIVARYGNGGNAIPRWLAIWCHGEADPVNFNHSRLLLGNPGVSFFDLQAADLQLRGASVLLSVCESDLSPPNLSGRLDEHLSLAAPFLHKGAGQVLTGLWAVRKDLMFRIVTGSLTTQSPLWQIVQEQQIGIMKDTGISEAVRLHRAAPVRVVGWPEGVNEVSTAAQPIAEEKA
ncbi:MAG: hypothetical protein HGA96_16595 [Desulfobulbaceae bacterium]|nr:hypothetical protein [Desulfobulbaceae bacterium]